MEVRGFVRFIHTFLLIKTDSVFPDLSKYSEWPIYLLRRRHVTLNQ